jgi:hypothetical protein
MSLYMKFCSFCGGHYAGRKKDHDCGREEKTEAELVAHLNVPHAEVLQKLLDLAFQRGFRAGYYNLEERMSSPLTELQVADIIGGTPNEKGMRFVRQIEAAHGIKE